MRLIRKTEPNLNNIGLGAVIACNNDYSFMLIKTNGGFDGRKSCFGLLNISNGIVECEDNEIKYLINHINSNYKIETVISEDRLKLVEK